MLLSENISKVNLIQYGTFKSLTQIYYYIVYYYILITQKNIESWPCGCNKIRVNLAMNCEKCTGMTNFYYSFSI